MTYEERYEAIRFLELLKWSAVKDRTIRINETLTSWKKGYPPPENTTPEGLEIYLNSMFLSYQKASTETQSHREEMSFKLTGEGLLSHQMTPETSFQPNPPDTYKVYLFASDALKLEPDLLDICTDLEIKGLGTGYAQPGFGYVPGSLIIIDSGMTNDFDTFLNMSEENWDNHLNNAIYNAKTNGEFDNLLMYHPLILQYEMSLESRKELIEYIMEEEVWGTADLDGIDEGELIYELFHHTTDAHGAELYDWLFEGTGSRFKSLHDLMQETIFFVPFIFILIRGYYTKLKSTGTSAIINTVKNLNINHIIPVACERVVDLYDKGVVLVHEYSESGSKIKFDVTLKKINLDMPGHLAQQTFEPDDDGGWGYNEGVFFDLDETVGVIPTIDRFEQGFIRMKIYPVPAFGVKAIHSLLSDAATDIVSLLFDLAAVAVPFLKMINFGITAIEVLSLFYGVVSRNIGDIRPFLENSDDGKRFLAAWEWVEILWNFKDGLEFYNRAAEMYHKYGKIVLNDFDDLAYLWDVYSNTADFTNNIGNNEDLQRLEKQLNRWKSDVAVINNSLNRTPTHY